MSTTGYLPAYSCSQHYFSYTYFYSEAEQSLPVGRQAHFTAGSKPSLLWFFVPTPELCSALVLVFIDQIHLLIQRSFSDQNP